MLALKLINCLLLTASMWGQAPEPKKPDPFIKLWDIESKPEACFLFLDIGHGDPAKPDFMTVTVAIDKETKKVAFISFIVPDKADKSMGLSIGFANSEKTESGGYHVKVVEGRTRILKFENCSKGDCTVRVNGGVVPASGSSPELNMLDQFLKNRMLLTFYWVNGKMVTAGTTLSGFHAQYPKVLQENLK